MSRCQTFPCVACLAWFRSLAVIVACCLRSDLVHGQLETALQRLQLRSERFASELRLLSAMRYRSFDLIVLDMSRGVGHAERILRWLSGRPGARVPVLLLANAITPERIAEAFDRGVDEVCSLPLEQVEFGARLRTLLRRYRCPPQPATITRHGFMLDHAMRTVLYEGRPVTLTAREFTLAWLLFTAPGAFVSRETIGAALQGECDALGARAIEQHVYKLRKKLGLGPGRGVLLRAAYTQGYRLELLTPDPIGGAAAPSP